MRPLVHFLPSGVVDNFVVVTANVVGIITLVVVGVDVFVVELVVVVNFVVVVAGIVFGSVN